MRRRIASHSISTVPHWCCPSRPCSMPPISVHLLTRFVPNPSPFHSSLLPDHSVRRHSETTLSLSLLSFSFTLDELVSSDVARELQLLFSDTASLIHSNPTALRKMKSHLEQFPSLASSQCTILSWFDASSDFHFRFISEMSSCSKPVVWCPTGIL